MKLLRYLFKLIRFRPVYFIQDNFSAVVSSLCTPVVGWLVKWFIDSITGEKPVPFSTESLLILLVSVFMVEIIAIYNMWVGYFKFQTIGSGLLIRNILSRILRRPGGVPLPKDKKTGIPLSEGVVLNTLTDDTEAISGFMAFFDDTIADLISAAICIYSMIRIDAAVTAMTFIPLIGLVLLVQLLSKRLKQYYKAARETTARVSELLNDLFNAVITVKAHHCETRICARLKQLNRERRNAALKSEILRSIINFFSYGLIQLGSGLILLVSASRLSSGTLSVGDYGLFTTYIASTLFIFIRGSNFFLNLRTMDVSIDRIEDLMEDAAPMAATASRKMNFHKPRIQYSPFAAADNPLEVLEIRNLGLHRSTQDDKGQVKEFELKDISFTLKRGSVTVITGPIGCGKSTLLKSVLGLIPRQSGEIFWNGTRVPGSLTVTDDESIQPFMSPPRAAFTSQVPRLFSDTLKENVAAGRPLSETAILDALSLAEFNSDLQAMPEGLMTKVGPKGMRLSGGQVQRTAAARMLGSNAQLMVLDDISSALDVETEQRLWESLKREFSEKTWLVVSHRESLLRLADQVIVMNNGKITAIGTWRQLTIDHGDLLQLYR